MPIDSQCSGCGKTLRVNDEFVGRKARCPVCGLVYIAGGGQISPDPSIAETSYAPQSDADESAKRQNPDSWSSLLTENSLEKPLEKPLRSHSRSHRSPCPLIALTRHPAHRSLFRSLRRSSLFAQRTQWCMAHQTASPYSIGLIKGGSTRLAISGRNRQSNGLVSPLGNFSLGKPKTQCPTQAVKRPITLDPFPCPPSSRQAIRNPAAAMLCSYSEWLVGCSAQLPSAPGFAVVSRSTLRRLSWRKFGTVRAQAKKKQSY